MSVKSQQVAKPQTANHALLSPVLVPRMRGFAGNHTLMRKQSPRETVARQPDETAQRRLSEGKERYLQRKCACGTFGQGGECAECKKPEAGMLQRAVQTKLVVSEPGDRYEQEADRIAEHVLAKPAHPDVSSAPPRIQRFTRQPSASAGTMPASVDRVLASPGRPLEPALEQDMQQRFSHDFSGVRVHSGPTAELSARDVNAHAYTVGTDIVFNAGRFTPTTHEGRRLIAHELTHVVQQSGSRKSTIQRMKIGTDTVTKEVKSDTTDKMEKVTLKPPPPKHTAKLNTVIERIRQVAEHPETYSACHDLFKTDCGGCDNGLSTLAEVFKKAVIRIDESEEAGAAWGLPCDPDIAYSQAGYDEGTEKLAGTIIHELGHVCGIRGSAQHHLADRIRLGCIRGARTLISFRGWNDPFVFAAGFRTVLKNSMSGKYALRGGLDVDLPGVLGADYPSQLASTMLRFEARAPLWWGAERWGGTSVFAEAGTGFGRFRVREPAAGDPNLAVHGGVIIGVGARLEWYLPVAEGRRYPLALTATIQSMIPLTREAERFQSFLIGVETWLGE